MRFKKTKGSGYSVSYQCYASIPIFDHKEGKMAYKEVRIARIDEPHNRELLGVDVAWSVNFVGGHANGEITNLIRIINKVKKLAKSYLSDKNTQE